MEQNNNNNEIKVGIESFASKFQNLSKSKKLSLIAFISVMICAMIFIIFSSNTSKPPKPQTKVADITDMQPSIISQNIQNTYTETKQHTSTALAKLQNKVESLKPPSPPKLDTTQVLKPTAPVPIKSQAIQGPKLPLPIPSNASNNQQQKTSTNIIAFGGGDGNKIPDNKTDPQGKSSAFLGFDGGMIDNTILQPTTAQSIIATKVNNDLKYMLLQGKIIDAVLETAINTQMTAGIVRAIISRDIYGEQGSLVLIPKGSRVIGNYTASSSSSSGSSSTTQTGQVSTRVYTVWKRIIMPSGVDINLPDTPSADPLGRSGIPGYLDTNLSNNLINAFLISVLGPYVATVVSGASKQTTTTTNNNSSNNSNGAQTTTTGTVGAQVLTQGLDQFNTVAQDQINAVYPPGITTTFVDQGTKIDIIIQQDISFPKQAIDINTVNLP